MSRKIVGRRIHLMLTEDQVRKLKTLPAGGTSMSDTIRRIIDQYLQINRVK